MSLWGVLGFITISGYKFGFITIIGPLAWLRLWFGCLRIIACGPVRHALFAVQHGGHGAHLSLRVISKPFSTRD